MLSGQTLPKSIYPFISINFRNLAPACHECNSTYKNTKNPAYKPKSPAVNGAGVRRKSFYPFAGMRHKIEISVDVQTSDWTHLQPTELSFSFGPEKFREQIDTWLDVYGIEERYSAKCCGENDGIGWIVEILDEWKEDGRDPADYLDTLVRQTQRRPYIKENFLKLPFLKACQEKGLLDLARNL